MNQNKLRLHHPALLANDFEKSRKFYIEGLGAVESMIWDFQPGDPVVKQAAYLEFAKGNYIELFSAVQPAERPAGYWLHLCFERDDIEGYVERTVKAGAVVTSPPRYSPSLTVIPGK